MGITTLCVTAACNGEAIPVGGPHVPSLEDPGTTTPTSQIITPSGTQVQSGKVDLVLMIDNSRSMGDKQELLSRSVPDLVTRLVAPHCVDGSRAVVGNSQNGICAQGQLEFAPVTDLHVGIVTSSLGGQGGDICSDAVGQNDFGHLITRTDSSGSTGSQLSSAPLGFLAFGAGGSTDVAQLTSDLTSLVAGVGTTGCGIEAQLESWYRFLVEPDPAAAIVVDPTKRAHYDGVDTVLLKQRHDFLRPDSLLSIVMLTDEDDSSINTLAFDGQGGRFASTTFPGSTVLRQDGIGTTASRATSVCASSPLDVTCTSCGLNFSPDDAAELRIRSDAECQKSGGYYPPEEDPLESRFFHMKARFGLDPQFPVDRYVQGLLSARVPDRAAATAPDGTYVGSTACQNPIYASALPTGLPGEDLCNLPPGPRAQRLVVLTVIAGAPPSLVHPNMGAGDWLSLVGSDPTHYAYDGADPHMVQSLAERPGLAPSSGPAMDPIHGREHTPSDELQYACAFDLTSPKPCGGPDIDCDCPIPGSELCDAAHPTVQIRARAYPSIRPFEVARRVGEAAVVASICPANAPTEMPSSPSFAYRPAMANLGNRMALSLLPARSP